MRSVYFLLGIFDPLALRTIGGDSHRYCTLNHAVLFKLMHVVLYNLRGYAENARYLFISYFIFLF